MPSQFLTHNPTAEPDSLAILHVRRNLLIPVVLKARDDDNEGYDEGKVTNTRYGSYPHSTMIGRPWGSQITASKVDTGSRGRRKKQASKAQIRQRREQEQEQQPGESGGLKRKADESEISEPQAAAAATQKEAIAAASGFIHLLRPTPESWTASLPHRTQVVYTPDYSYILHRLQARPGGTIIEAGAGSGSFTHAAARAVFNGYPTSEQRQPQLPQLKRQQRFGKVCSFEFHEQRVGKLRDEILAHGLEGIVHVSHRDVYNEGFLLGQPSTGESPRANAIFLDLPSPWLALKHLVREPADGSVSPLDPLSPVHICTFSPCLEQAQQTISALRRYSWLSISMVEVAHRNLEVRREKFAVEGREGGRGISGPRSVEEAVSRLRAQEEHLQRQIRAEREKQKKKNMMMKMDDISPSSDAMDVDAIDEDDDEPPSFPSSQPPRVPTVPEFKQGRLIHRPETEIKTHTSYLVFAILPRSWSEEDEKWCRERWPSNQRRGGSATAGTDESKKSKKQLERESKQRKKQASKAAEVTTVAKPTGEADGQ